MKKLLALTCSLALVPALAACGDDEEDGGDTGGAGGAVPTEQSQETGRVGAPEQARANAEVTMKNVEFQPENVTVKRGGTVKWTNDEAVPHDVTKESGPGKNFKSGEPGAMNKGDSYTQSFSAPGKIEYMCTVHPKMVGTITVK